MANLTFPSNPVNGQTYEFNGKLFRYNSTTQRWSATRAQLLGALPDDITIETPDLTLDNTAISFSASNTTVYVHYTVSDDVSVSIANNGLANSSYATATLSRSNNTITITSGATEFSTANVVVTATNNRTSNTASINLSAAYGYVVPTNFSTQTQDSSYGSGTSNGGYLSLSADGTKGCIIRQGTTDVSFLLEFATPFDSSTITVTQKTSAISNYGVYSAQFSRDGLHLLLSDGGPNIIHRTLTTPFDITSKVSAQTYATAYSGSRCTAWTADGYGFIYRNSLNGDVWYYVPLSTAYDFTSAGTASSATISGTGNSNPATAAHNAWISYDGTEVVYINSTGFVVITLSTAYDFSTASVGSTQSFSTAITGSNKGWAPRFDGSQIIVSSSDMIKTFSL